MAENTSIEWADSTFNPWVGCTKVSPGCDHCYAAVSTPARAMGIQWGPGQLRHRTATTTWQLPLRWERAHEAFYAEHGKRRRVFCSSLADVFDNEVPPDWRAELFELIAATPHLDWLLLTKRIGNVPNMLPVPFDFDRLYPHVAIGATIVDREEMLRDGPKLKASGARVTFWSAEPMLGDLGEIPRDLLPDWVICGGESGPHARPMNGEWARVLRDQCKAAGVPFLFKQWGEWICAGDLRRLPGGGMPGFGIYDACGHDMATDSVRVGKRATGRLLDGVEHNGFPEVRQ